MTRSAGAPASRIAACVFVTCAVAAGGCEAVLGVGELHYAEDAVDASSSAPSDAASDATADVIQQNTADATNQARDVVQENGGDAANDTASATDNGGAPDTLVAGDRTMPPETGNDAPPPDAALDTGAEAAIDAGKDASPLTYPTTPPGYPLNANATAVAIADLNGDGALDLAVSIFGGTVGLDVLPGWGDGTFKAAQGFGQNSLGYAVRVADVNKDGKPDVVLLNGQATSTLQVFINGSSGGVLALALSASYNLGPEAGAANWYSFEVGDLNKDGYPDLVASNFGGNNVDILLNNGAGGFGTPSSLVVGNAPNSVAIADLNGDGNPDIATANFNDSSVGVLLGIGNGTFAAVSAFPVGQSSPQAIAAADMNGDGKIDLVVNHNVVSGAVSVLLNNGSAQFSKATGSPFSTGGPYEDSLAVADLDGDGRIDVATTNFGVCCWPAGGAPGMLSLLFGTGGGVLSAPQVFPTVSPSDNLHGVAIGDLDGNGRPDIVVTTKAYHNVFVYLANH